MNRKICIAACVIHLSAMAVSTYIASIKIETILATGFLCSFTGLIAGIAALACKRPILALPGLMVPVLAVMLFVLEACFLNLGPGRAAMPFGIIFLFNQSITTPTILVQLSLLCAPAAAAPRQIALRTLLVAMTSFAVFFGIARHLLSRPHDWLMASALGLLGLTFVGLCVLACSVIANRRFSPVVGKGQGAANNPSR